jgi:hypothetical protein
MAELLATILAAVLLAGWGVMGACWPVGFRPLAGWGEERHKHTAPTWRLTRKGE